MLRHVDSTFIALSWVFLALIVFLPFPTEIRGVYDGTRTVVVFYAPAMTMTGLLSTAVCQYALTHGLMDDRLTAAWRRGGWYGASPGPVVFATSIPIGFVTTDGARFRWILLVSQHWAGRWFGGSDEPFGPSERTG